jgi:uncharacterized protein (TIGR02145 family)
MKKIITFLTVFMLAGSLLAQVPQSFNYQAVVRDAGGQIIANTQVGMKISILQGTVDGTAVCIEEFTPTTNDFGLVTLAIGSMNTTDFADIDWSAGPYFIKVELDPAGGTSYGEMGTTQLLSVPYSLHAKTVESITEADPVFGSSIAGGITEVDTANWNNKLESYIETDPVFGASVAAGISGTDTTNWNNKLDAEVDGSVTNEIQTISRTGLTVTLTDGGSYTDSVNVFTGNMKNQNITNLADPVNDQDAASKAYVDALLERINELESQPGIVKDYDNNLYTTIKIGNQVWIAENLKTTHYANGDAIPDGTGAGNIFSETDPEYWFAYDDDLDNVSNYGRLYTWYTVTDSRNVCPDGWHVPTDAEWTELTDYLGGTSISGGKLKETGTTHWNSTNTGATNETGFTALPGGMRNGGGTFYNIGSYGFWWSSTESSTTLSWARSLSYMSTNVYRDGYSKESGYSVRCLRD